MNHNNLITIAQYFLDVKIGHPLNITVDSDLFPMTILLSFRNDIHYRRITMDYIIPDEYMELDDNKMVSLYISSMKPDVSIDEVIEQFNTLQNGKFSKLLNKFIVDEKIYKECEATALKKRLIAETLFKQDIFICCVCLDNVCDNMKLRCKCKSAYLCLDCFKGIRRATNETFIDCPLCKTYLE